LFIVIFISPYRQQRRDADSVVAVYCIIGLVLTLCYTVAIATVFAAWCTDEKARWHEETVYFAAVNISCCHSE